MYYLAIASSWSSVELKVSDMIPAISHLMLDGNMLRWMIVYYMGMPQ